MPIVLKGAMVRVTDGQLTSSFASRTNVTMKTLLEPYNSKFILRCVCMGMLFKGILEIDMSSRFHAAYNLSMVYFMQRGRVL